MGTMENPGSRKIEVEEGLHMASNREDLWRLEEGR
jgi:hypothetical protein